MFQTKVVEEIKIHILCSVTFFLKSCLLWDNVEKISRAGGPQISIWRMRFACWIPKATNTNTHTNTICNILLLFHCNHSYTNAPQCYVYNKYRVIRKSLRDFRPLRYSSRDGHAEGEHVNRGRDTPIFWPTLQVLDMSTLGDAADVNTLIQFLPHTCNVCGRNWIDTCRVTNGGHIEHL